MGTIDSWSSIETVIKQRLDRHELDRRFCAICGRQGSLLSRCFGCQMVYYCGEEHQAEDWSNEHIHKCAQLEWVALGEFIQALPAQPPLPSLGDKWPLSLKEINTWKNWFSIRANIVQLANNTASIFQNLVHLTDKRQPTHQNAVDGLLAAVTDLLTHALTIGKAVTSFGLLPNIRPLVIHILSGFNKIDLLSSDQSSSSNLPARFHELLNMFPDNKGVELVIVIGDDDQNDTDCSSLPHATLKPDRLIITTTGKGRLFDTSQEKRLQQSEADLLVYLNAAYLFSSSNKELLKSMLTRQRPSLLTFEDEEEFNRAKAFLSTKNIKSYQAGTNQFGSLIVRQRSNRPNSTYSTNSYQILLNAVTVNGAVERNEENYSLLSRQRSHQSSIDMQHTYIPQQQQFNPGLKQVNGKIHIESLSSLSTTSSSSSSSSHNTQANNNGTPLDTNVHIVSTTNTNVTTTVQPVSRANNNTRQPPIVQRQHHSQSTSIPTTLGAPSTTYRETQPSNAEMLTAIEPTRNDIRPQPKPRLSLAKTTRGEEESFVPSRANGSIVQRFKPVFEQPTITLPQESKPIRQQQQSVSIPYTYQIGKATKATCLDDVVTSNNVSGKSAPPPIPPPPPPADTYNHERIATTATIIPTFIPVEIHRDQPPAMNTTNQMSRPFIERHKDERTIKSPPNSVSSPLPIPIEIHHNQRPVMNVTSSVSMPSSLSTEHRFDERIIPAAPLNVSSTSSQSNEKHRDQSTVVTPATTSDSPPPRPPPPSSFVNNEVIYTEVIKSPERSFPKHHIDLTKAPISPSRSFIIPTKSPSISSKNSSFNFQRPSRPMTVNNFSYQTNKPRPLQSTIAPDRISLYSQRSTKHADVGVTIKNLSECIDRVGIVFDETNRPNNVPTAGLTTVDLIREQLTSSAASKPTGSLLDKLYKSNSSTRLSGSSSRPSTNHAFPRSKSQQATRASIEQPSVPQTISVPTPPPPVATSPTTSQPVRRTVGVFLPLTPKNTPEPVQSISSPSEQQAPGLVYQNLEPHTTLARATSPLRMSNYTLKQHIGPVCSGVPKPFRKPTAIIEPSPVVTSPTSKTPEPNYINLALPDEHIYTNENGHHLPSSSNSNSYTSKTSSVYSSSDKQNLSNQPEIVYAVSNIPSSSQPDPSADYDSFDDELVVDDAAKIEKPFYSNDNTDDDSFDDDENQPPVASTPSKNSSKNFLRSTLNRLTRSNKSLERLATDSTTNDITPESNPSNILDTKSKKTLRSIKARHEAKKTGNAFLSYTNDDDTTSIDSNCSTQTATSLNKTSKSSHNRFRLFRRKVEKEFASDTEAEKHQTEQRRKKFNKKMLNQTADELKAKRLLMMSDDDDDETNLPTAFLNDEPHIYDRIVHDENDHTSSSRMGKLSNETHVKSPTITLDEIRSEIQAEIAARHENLPTINQSLTSSNLTLQKKRSKSVTFLDELLGDDSQQKPANLISKRDPLVKPSAVKRVEKGDARSICGALTGTGPIRGIIKAANNDITGTTSPISPPAAAAIYLSGSSIETRCTSPKASERAHRPLSTYTVGSTRFYDGSAISSTPAPPPPPPPPPPPSFNHNTNQANPRSMLNNSSHHSTSDSAHHKRPTAKVSPFQTKSPNDTSSSPISSVSKKPIRPAIQRHGPMSHDMTHIATPSISDGVGGVSKRLQSNF